MASQHQRHQHYDILMCRLWEISRQERARSSRLASSSSHEPDFGNTRGPAKSQQWDAALFGPTGLLPGQSHTPTRIGRDLHELVMETSPSPDTSPGTHSSLQETSDCALALELAKLLSGQGKICMTYIWIRVHFLTPLQMCLCV